MSDPSPSQSEDPFDLITLLQQKLIEQSANIVNYIGKLQANAPPAPIKDPKGPRSQVLEQVSTASVAPDWQETVGMPDTLVQQAQTIETLIDCIPDAPAEEGELQAIAELLRRNNELDKELKEETEKAEARLQRGLDVGNILGQHALLTKHLSAQGVSVALEEAAKDPSQPMITD